jgi:hypothetical protein
MTQGHAASNDTLSGAAGDSKQRLYVSEYAIRERHRIEDLDRVVLHDEDVARFQVAVDQAAFVGDLEPAAGLAIKSASGVLLFSGKCYSSGSFRFGNGSDFPTACTPTPLSAEFLNQRTH